MLSTKRLLLGLLVLGIVGMHGLATTSGTAAAHHGWSAAVAALTEAPAASTASAHEHSAPAHAATATTSRDVVLGAGGGSTALALCMALLLAFGVVALAGRRTTWVAELAPRTYRLPLPRPPVLPDTSPVSRFTVMRC